MSGGEVDNAKLNPWESFYQNIAKYQTPDVWKSIWQIINTFIPYLGIWFLIVYSLSVSYWLTALLIVPAAGFLVRLFIIFHDCGHGSFFKSQKANSIVGIILGVFTFTPYFNWHKKHMKHHATVGNLDKRGDGDVWTMTTEEYLNSSKWKKLQYRIYRHPITMFGVGSLYVFLVENRITNKNMSKKEKHKYYFTNVGLIAMFALNEVGRRFFSFSDNTNSHFISCFNFRILVILSSASV